METGDAERAILSMDVMQHVFTVLGIERTREVASVCRAWSDAARGTHKWWRSLLPAAEREKEAGNQRFQAKDFAAAVRSYTEALRLIRQHQAWLDEHAERADAAAHILHLTCLANRAACYLHGGEISDAAMDAAAATFSGRLRAARDAKPAVATKAALRLLEAAERAADGSLAIPALQTMFGTARGAAQAAAMEAHHLARPCAVPANLRSKVVEAEERLGVSGPSDLSYEMLVAIAHGCLDQLALDRLLASGASVNATDEQGNRPLFLAAEMASRQGSGAEVVKLLLRNGAWAGGRTKSGGMGSSNPAGRGSVVLWRHSGSARANRGARTDRRCRR